MRGILAYFGTNKNMPNNGFDPLGMRTCLENATQTTKALTGFIQETRPALKKSLEAVTTSSKDLVKVTQRLEQRLEGSLDEIDDAVNFIQRLERKIEDSLGKLDFLVHTIFVLLCIALFAVCDKLRFSYLTEHLTHELLTIMAAISLITATGVLLRVFYISVLKDVIYYSAKFVHLDVLRLMHLQFSNSIAKLNAVFWYMGFVFELIFLLSYFHPTACKYAFETKLRAKLLIIH